MFYSHQLLARKAPLGQIWMAATMHAKINRRKLHKLNIIKICEEILNPSVPMALRLSGILMGGVVIVYERKVKLLYDDVTHLLVELNEAWKVKAVADPTVLPKGKSQAKKEAVTLPENEETDVEEIEHSLNFPHTTMQFQQNAYFEMRLDSVDEPYINSNAMEEDPPQQFHQADVEDITLTERFDSDQADTNRFERFDIEGDEETLLNFTQIPNTLIPSPPPQDKSPKAYQHPEPQVNQHPESQVNQHPEPQVNQPSAECKEFGQAQGRQGPIRRRIRRTQAPVIDCEQTIIHGHVYQSWLQDASDIVSRRGRKRQCTNIMSTMKIANLMELPPLVLIDDLFTPGNKEIYYPPPLLDLWMKSTQPPHDSPSELTSPPLPPEPSSSSHPERQHYQEPVGYPFEDFHSGAGSPSLRASIERQRTNFPNSDIPPDFMMEQLGANLMNNGMGGIDSNLMVTPANSDGVRSIPSSGSGQGVPSHGSIVNSARSNKKRPHSSTRLNSGGLEPVSEENTWSQPDPDFMLSRLSENGLTPEQELLVETGPTQTQKPIITDPLDNITDAIRMQMKAHFDTAGTPQVESLNKLAAGMNRKGAAMFFYRTCVLATRDFLKVEQKVPYGEILISRGARM